MLTFHNPIPIRINLLTLPFCMSSKKLKIPQIWYFTEFQHALPLYPINSIIKQEMTPLLNIANQEILRSLKTGDGRMLPVHFRMCC
jgi:hypothetical protein